MAYAPDGENLAVTVARSIVLYDAASYQVRREALSLPLGQHGGVWGTNLVCGNLFPGGHLTRDLIVGMLFLWNLGGRRLLFVGARSCVWQGVVCGEPGELFVNKRLFVARNCLWPLFTGSKHAKMFRQMTVSNPIQLFGFCSR